MYFGLKRYLASLNDDDGRKIEEAVKRFNFFIVRCDDRTVAVRSMTKAVTLALLNNGRVEEINHGR